MCKKFLVKFEESVEEALELVDADVKFEIVPYFYEIVCF